MIQQVVKPKPTTPLAGILLIAGLFVGLLAASFLGRVFDYMLRTNYCSIAVWLLAALTAVAVMRGRVMEYRYTVDSGRVYIERMFGKTYSKILLNIPVTDILAYGEEAQLKGKYPAAKFTRKAWLPGCTLPKIAYLYRKDGELEILLAQPDEAMQKALYDPEARKRSTVEKWG